MIINLPFSQGADGESDRFQGGGGGSGVGPDRATINIRGLGPSRSLVLINGRRTTWSPIPIGADTQLLVDVNMLPLSHWKISISCATARRQVMGQMRSPVS